MKKKIVSKLSKSKWQHNNSSQLIYHLMLSLVTGTRLCPKNKIYAASSAAVPNSVPFHGHSRCVSLEREQFVIKTKKFFLYNRKAQRETKDVQRTMAQFLPPSQGEIEISVFHQKYPHLWCARETPWHVFEISLCLVFALSFHYSVSNNCNLIKL